ncbi:hypothetical protein [Henriciella aquimarina]|uniref:hypothetical protein n=1 Tax=Henriciella aquimarina TaxID=545261 RepID=UPI00117BB4EE|nr:hypothetical protein [Henriciella aquimarina]
MAKPGEKEKKIKTAPGKGCADSGPIRPAGPDCMKSPPDSWDEIDEDSDESFPASDAPGNY